MGDHQRLETEFSSFKLTSKQIKYLRQIAYAICDVSKDIYYDIECDDDRLYIGYKYFVGKTLTIILHDTLSKTKYLSVSLTHGQLLNICCELEQLIDVSISKADKFLSEKLYKILCIDSGYNLMANDDLNLISAFCKDFLKKDAILPVHPDGFSCKCCGACCQYFYSAYQGEATYNDMLRWSLLGRFDILEWVDDIGDIWISPKTHDDVSRCPWLRKRPHGKGYKCRIHEVKPDTCRGFPHHIDHALRAGCKGFSKNQGNQRG